MLKQCFWQKKYFQLKTSIKSVLFLKNCKTLWKVFNIKWNLLQKICTVVTDNPKEVLSFHWLKCLSEWNVCLIYSSVNISQSTDITRNLVIADKSLVYTADQGYSILNIRGHILLNCLTKYVFVWWSKQMTQQLTMIIMLVQIHH